MLPAKLRWNISTTPNVGGIATGNTSDNTSAVNKIIASLARCSEEGECQV